MMSLHVHISTLFTFQSLKADNASVVVSARILDKTATARTREALPWLTEVTSDNFTVCMRERILFYGHHTARMVRLISCDLQGGFLGNMTSEVNGNL